MAASIVINSWNIMIYARVGCYDEITVGKTGLTPLCRVHSSTLTLWTGLFPIQECPVSFYYYHV